MPSPPTWTEPLRRHLSLLLPLAVCSAQLAAQAPLDTLPRRLVVVHNGLQPGIGRLCRVQVGKDFSYIGGQRFILQSIADAEQHFFVKSDSTHTIEELYWIQAERMLPGQTGGYTYADDSTRTWNGLPWKVDLRLNRGGPRAGSDGAAMRDYLARLGYRFPALAPRLRLVYLPTSGGPSELMIVYLAALSTALPDTTLPGIFRRATGSLEPTGCP